MPARSSHRPVRAFLMHTVPQIMGSLRDLLPVAVSLTRYSNFYAFAVFPNNGSTIRRLASLHAVREVPFPPFAGTIKALRLAAVLSRRAWFPSLGAATRRALGFAPAVSKRNHGGPGVLYIRPLLRPAASGEDNSISQVPGKPPLCLCPVLRLRCDGSLLTLTVRAAWLP